MFISLTPVIFARIRSNLIKNDQLPPKLIPGILLFISTLIAFGIFYFALKDGITLG